MDKIQGKSVWHDLGATPSLEDNNKEEEIKASEIESSFVSAFWMLVIIFAIFAAVIFSSKNDKAIGNMYDSASSVSNSQYEQMQEDVEIEYGGDFYEYVRDNISKVQG